MKNTQMANAAINILEQIFVFWHKRRTFKGLIGLIILLNFALISIFGFALSILTKAGLIVSTEHNRYFLASCFLLLGLANIGLLLLWAYWRTLPVVKDGKLVILFAPHADEDASSLVRKLHHEFCEDIASRHLQDIMQCKLLPENHLVRNSGESHDLLMKTGAHLVVYGTVLKGKIKGDSVQGFRTISFTIRMKRLPQGSKKFVAANLSSVLTERKFFASDENSFIEESVVIQNLSEVSRFFIGVALMLESDFKQSSSLLEPLLTEIEAKKKATGNDPQLSSFSEVIKSCLAAIFDRLFAYKYDEILINHITERQYDEQAHACNEILDKLLAIDKKTPSYYLGKAITQFHFGNLKEAFKSAEHAKRIAPFDNPAAFLSLAFLHLWIRDYKSAFMQYMRAGKRRVKDMHIVTGVLEFLNTMIRLYPERKDFLFALAFVNDRFFDQDTAFKDYQAFLESGVGSEMDEFTKFAQHQIDRIQEAKETQPTETSSKK